MARGDAFVGFTEGAVASHPPTFKVKRHPGLSYTRQRSPAYCDRVLWRSMPGHSASQIGLWCASSVGTSDHKPVGSAIALSREQPRTVWSHRAVFAGGVSSALSAHGWAAPSARNSLRDAARERAAAHAVPTWSIQLVALHGHSLMAADYNGKSDPYVAFRGSALAKMEITAVVTKTLDPTWTGDKLPTLIVCAANEEEARAERVLLQVSFVLFLCFFCSVA